jgi:formate hydrogenlyase subunit 3/multisubunit Na+/H+ antiporter MnhD subunit
MFSSRNLLSPNEYFKDSGDFFFYKNGVFQFSLNLYGLILVFLCLITGFVAISTVNNLYFEEKLKFYLIFFQFLLAILGFIKSSDLITFFFFYEVLMLGSFLIVYYGSYSKKAVQASLYFVL